MYHMVMKKTEMNPVSTGNCRSVQFLPTLCLFIILILCFLTLPVSAGTETLVSVNTSTSNQIDPAIFGDWIVWTDSRMGPLQVFAYNIDSGTEIRISPPGSFASQPDIFDDRIVWRDRRNGNYDIYLFNVTTRIESRITSEAHNQQLPEIFGNLIAWQDDRNGQQDIYAYNTQTSVESLLTPDTMDSDQENPAVYGTNVVWQDKRNYNNAWGDYLNDIFMNNTATGELWNVSEGNPDGNEITPAISGDLVVWSDDRKGDFLDIYLNNTLTGSQDLVSEDTFDLKILPAIDGSNVIWLDNRDRTGSSYDIFFKDITTIPGIDTRITVPTAMVIASGKGPKIKGDRIVWTDNRNGNNDIFMYTLGPDEICPVANFSVSAQSGAAPLTVSFSDTSSPGTTAISHRKWEFGDGNTTTDQLNPAWTYTVPGTYDVRLTVNNPLCRNETPVSPMYKVSVGSAPVASFTTDQTSGMVPLTISFTDTSVAATVWNWSFGDGTYSNLQDPSHTFPLGGTYSVALNASNPYGYSLAHTTIHALTGANETADTTINGIAISTPFGTQFLTYDTTQLPGPVNTGNTLVCTSPQLLAHGWQNITFVSQDGIGFIPHGTLIKGNISGVTFQTREINPVGFSIPTGALSSINYSIVLPSYPAGATLNTLVWEGDTPEDQAAFDTIASGAGYTNVWGIAYTTKIIKTNFPAVSTGTLHVSVNSTWVQNFNGRTHTFGERISDDRSTGEVLPSRFLYNDPVKNLDFFEINVPHGFSTFGLSQLSGTGNPFQLITLTVASHISAPSGSEDNSVPNTGSGPGSGTGQAAAPAPIQNVNRPPALAPPADPGKTEKIYANANGVISQTTLLTSPDERAQLSIGPGVVAKDSAGAPLTSVTLTAVPAENLPPVPASGTYTFAGVAYNFEPAGATFSPAVFLSFSYPPNVPLGQEFTVKTFDSQSGTWIDLPTTYDSRTGRITAQVSHFCYIALFTKQIAATNPPHKTVTPAPVQMKAPTETPPSPPAGNALSFFIDMMAWVTGLVMKNIYLVVIIAVLGIAYIVKRWKYPGSGF